MGRPSTDIPQDQVVKMASYHCTNREIADFFGVDESLISKRFSSIITKRKSETRNKLRKMQWEEAEEGNWKMMIWLGKQMLGQRDIHDVTTDGQPIGGFEIKVDNKKTATKLAKLIN